MKKVFLLALAALTALSLVACQPTPQESIVKGKNLEKMIDSATKTKPPTAATNTAGETAAPADVNIAQQMGVQPQYTKELSDAQGKVKIHVDADVVVPDAKGVTVQRVLPQPLTQATIDTLLNGLVKGKSQMFDGDSYKLSKSELQEKILAFEAAMTQQSTQSDANVNPKLQGERGQSILQGQLDELKKQLETAPDTAVKEPTEGKLHLSTDGGNYQTLHALAQSDASGYESFLTMIDPASNVDFVRYTSEKNGFADGMGYFYSKAAVEQAEASGYRTDISSAEIAQIPDVKLTEDQAKEKAQQLLQSLGINNMVCYSAEKQYGGSSETTLGGQFGRLYGDTPFVNPRKAVWYLRYARGVNGIPTTYTVWDCMKVEEDNQSAPWSYEDMTFAIDDSGIVGFEWRSPYQVTDTVTENSNVLSFTDAMHIFDTMSLAVNAWDGYAEGNPTLKGIDIEVGEIRFGLTRITEQDKRNSGLLVPAWDFFGNVTYIMEKDGKTQKMVDGPVPILTVNAIDGSIINRSLGY